MTTKPELPNVKHEAREAQDEAAAPQPTVSKDGPRSTSERAEPGEINLLLLLLNDVRMMIRHGYEYRDREVLERVERAREHWTGKLLRAARPGGGGSDTEGAGS